ncbi:ABC transporter permease (plasmid) [Pontibacillus sp. ALD_SL1]|uniref:ABC transporter permease n=1 Tax=Pontibacillus sp. ALD_SL1 TaxID=2777185 RepID=UPI001A97C150|nr:ABC transporter permease [Pontibacillus sp. ALD_SL1]QST02829.1 ABC transporter permease [Pontibacillus sp. ALD_SL1]
MPAFFHVIKEQVAHFHMTRRLSIYEIKNKNRNNMLGSSWEIINPLIQMLIYWFVFQNVRQHSTMVLPNGETVPFVYWMLSGFILWIFFYKSTIEGSNSVYSRIKMLSKMKFPMSIIPSYVIFSYFYVHLIILGITVLLFLLGGYYPNLYYLQLLYFVPALLLFLFSLSLIMSTLSTMLRDVHMFLNAVLRMVLYLSPILWEIGNLGGWIGFVARLNPLYYLIEGYRSALFGTGWYLVEAYEYTLYFWGLTVLLFGIGASIHMKFRRHFIDYV